MPNAVTPTHWLRQAHRAGSSSFAAMGAPPPLLVPNRSSRRARLARSSSFVSAAGAAPKTSAAPRHWPPPPRARLRESPCEPQEPPPPCQPPPRSSCCQPPRPRRPELSSRRQLPPQLPPRSHHLPPVQVSSIGGFTRETSLEVFEAWISPSSVFVRITLSCFAISSSMSIDSSSVMTACPTLRRLPSGMPKSSHSAAAMASSPLGSGRLRPLASSLARMVRVWSFMASQKRYSRTCRPARCSLRFMGSGTSAVVASRNSSMQR
mmetsp:Transcript_29729/g.85107  ORF Transcript_29729/g.85107 Transcript_29729/m.85107 type:complete len:264 (+) Transcript_29729:64-855(+)